MSARRLSAHRTISDIRIARELVEEADDLWPCRPRMIALFRHWLERAHEFSQRLELHRETLNEIRARPKSQSEELAYEDRWQLAVMNELVDIMKHLTDTKAGLIADVERRLLAAQEIENKTIEAYVDEWAMFLDDIAEDPLFSSSDFEPQLGLIPLARQASTGLWEFWAPETGEAPEFDESKGHFVVRDETAMVLVLVPGGDVILGASLDPGSHHYDPDAFDADVPPGTVRLDPFFISKYEMTQGQWLRVTGYNPSLNQDVNPSLGRFDPLRHPVELVSWNDCVQTLKRLDLVLPTEAQWEYVARAGSTTPFHCGRDSACLERVANISDEGVVEFLYRELPVEWGIDDGYVQAAPVGHYEPNRFGLFDVHGNVAEWCSDEFATPPWPRRAGDGLIELGGDRRSYRGGSSIRAAISARCAARFGILPDSATLDIGVRPARRVQRED